MNRDDYATLSKDSYEDHNDSRFVKFGGVSYEIFAAASTPTGFQATAYRQLPDGDVIIAYRGTEAVKAKFWDQPVKDLGADYDMVLHLSTQQMNDADVFTQRVFEKMKRIHPDWNLHDHVSVTGHSLGGAIAEVMASRYRLGGSAYNPYGAVDLNYGVPEGQPADAPPFNSYVRATDVVSAASRHYGSVHVFATAKDIDNLRDGRYLDAPNPAHPANPLLAASLTAHFVTNFAPDIGGESVMSADNDARYRQYKSAIDHYRHDVMASRIDLYDVLEYQTHPEQSARLQTKVTDALSVASYTIGVNRAAALSGVTTDERVLGAIAHVAHDGARSAQAMSAGVAHGVQAVGDVAMQHADVVSHNASIEIQQVQDVMKREISDRPTPASVDIMPGGEPALGMDDVGQIVLATTQSYADMSRAASYATQSVTQSVSQGARAIGETAHDLLDDVSHHAHAAEAFIERAVHVAGSVQMHDRLQDAITPDSPTLAPQHGSSRETPTHTVDTRDHAASTAVENKAPQGDQATAERDVGNVTQLQQHLQTVGMTDARGQPLSVTGIHDDVTRMAVTMFQKEQGLPATGLPDTATCALAKAHAAIAELQRSAATPDISHAEVTQRESAVTLVPPPSIDRVRAPGVIANASRDDGSTPDHSSMSAHQTLDDPRDEHSSHHALYDMLKTRIPEASEKRLLQFTAACHANQIHVDNLDQIHFDRVKGRMSFTPSWPPGPTAVVDLKAAAPEPQQSMQHLQRVDQQQAQMMMDIRAYNAQQAQSQQAPMR